METEKKRLFRYLRADEIEVRKGQFIGEDKSKCELLLYKTARTDYALLDETFGPFGWSIQYKTENGMLFAGIGIKDPVSGVYIYKWNAGAEQNFEREKSLASDCAKRAGFAWGLGTELYSSPKIVVPNENKAYKVSEISYEDGKIKDLTITDKFDNVIYSYRDFKPVGGVSQGAPTKTYTSDIEGVEAFIRDRWEGADKDTKHLLSAFHTRAVNDPERIAKYGVQRCFKYLADDVKNGTVVLEFVTPPGVDQKGFWRAKRVK